jgi:hypothetical protein
MRALRPSRGVRTERAAAGRVGAHGLRPRRRAGGRPGQPHRLPRHDGLPQNRGDDRDEREQRHELDARLALVGAEA